MQVSAIFSEISNITETIGQNSNTEPVYSAFTSSDKNDKNDDMYNIINTWKAFCIKQLKAEEQQNIDYLA